MSSLFMHSTQRRAKDLAWNSAMMQAAPVRLPDSTIGQTGAGNYTVEFWMHQTSSGFALPVRAGTEINYFRLITILSGQGDMYLDVGNYDVNGRTQVNAPIPLVGRYVHVAYVHASDAPESVGLNPGGRSPVRSGAIQVYLNGTLVYNEYRTGEIDYSEIEPFALLAAGVVIGEFRYWNKLRSQAEIQATMNLSLSGPRPYLLLSYRLNERGPAGTKITDRSGHGLHARTY